MMLTEKNYYSTEAAWEYMSVSQFKNFERCEACAMAELNGEYVREKNPALLVGSYVDSYFEGDEAFQKFKDENPEIFKKDGSLKAEYIRAEQIIDRIESDEVFMAFLGGEKQTIMTGDIGVPVKIKMDSYFPPRDDGAGAIVDMKIMKNFLPIWKDAEKMAWFDAWGYTLQLSVYQEVVFLNTGYRVPVYIVAATKEPVTDIQCIHIEQEFLDERLNYFRGMVQHYDDIKRGLAEPERCEHCDYCKQTKKLKIVNASDVYYDME